MSERIDAKLWDCNGISILGNPNNGAIIGLNQEGKQYVQKLLDNGGKSSDPQSNEEEMIWEEMKRLSFLDSQKTNSKLKSAYLHVTDRCNLHCVGCYSYVDHRNQNLDLTTHQMEEILEKLSKSGVEELVISGGEPFLRPDINRILSKAKSLGMIICVISNGTLEIDHYLPVINYIDTLSISVDGYEPGVSYIRDTGATEKALQLANLLKEKVNVHLIFTIHKKNVGNLSKYIKTANDLGVSFNFSIFTVNPHNTAFSEYLLDESDLGVIADAINKGDDVFIEDSVMNGRSDGIEGLRCTLGCGLGCKMISVAADGNVYPCHMLHNSKCKMGNIINNDLSEILSKDTVHCSDLNVERIDECNRCEYKYFCGGGCRGRGFLYYDKLEAKDPFCVLTKKYLEQRTEIFKQF